MEVMADHDPISTLLQAFVPLLRKDNARSGRQGRIINMSSVYGSYGMAFQGPYCASKSALEGMSDALRQEMRIYEIPVILIRPGRLECAAPAAAEIRDQIDQIESDQG